MKKYIYCNYYSDANPGRREENLRCVHHNLALPWLDGMIVFLDNPDHARDINPNSKITFVTRNQRMTFRDAVQHAHDTLEPASVFIIINLDIMIEDNDAWQSIDRDFFQTGWPHKAMVCKRHNIAADGSLWIEEESWRKGEFCDAYVLTTPIAAGLLSEDLDFCVGGAPQCDNTMMYLMHRYYHVFSWGDRYRILHLDLVRKQHNNTGMILNSMTDYRASRRRDQHIDIPAYQDWHRLLREQLEPSYLPTWRLHTLSFQISTPDIG